MTKYIIGAIFVVLAGAVGYYLWTIMSDVGQPAEGTQPPVEQPTTYTYATTTYSVTYPLAFTPDTAYAYTQFEGKPIGGVKFTIPMEMATGTNLSADSYVSVEQLPRAANCTGDIYVVPNVKRTEMTDGATVYSVATTSGAAVGSRYEEQVWALKGSSPCTAVRYYIHSMAIENFEPGMVREYDRGALLAKFDEIRRSLVMKTQVENTGLTP